MKLPLYQPTNTVPVRSPQSGAAVDPTGAGLAQIGSDLMQAGRQFGVIAGQDARDQRAEEAHAERLRAALEKEKQAHLDDIGATADLNGAANALDRLEIEMKRGVRDPNTDKFLPGQEPVGPMEYQAEWEKRANVVRNQLLEPSRTPGAEFRVRKGAEQLFGTRRHDATTYSDTLAVTEYKAGFAQARAEFERRIATELDPERAAALEKEFSAAFVRARGMIDLTTLHTQYQQSVERIDTTKARLLAEVDPQGVIDALRGPAKDSPYRLEPDKATALADHLESQWRTRVKDEEVRAKAATTAWETAWHGYQQTQYVDDYLAMRDNNLSTEQAKQNAREWHYTPAQVKELLDGIDKPAKEAKSDPGTLLRFTADVNGMNPRSTENDIKVAMANEQLSIPDGRQLLNTLTSRRREQQADARMATSQAQTAANEQRTALKYDQAEAEQQLKAAMGIPDILPPGFSPEVSAAFTQAKQKLANRSAAFPSQGGKENPLTVVRQIIPEAQQAAGLYGRVKERDLIRLLPADLGKLAAQGPDGFLAASRLLDAQRKTLGEPEFGRIAQTFAELRALYRDLAARGVLTPPTPSTAAPSGGFTVPKAPKGSR